MTSAAGADARALARALLLYAPPTLASAAAGFGGVYLFTRILGPSDYGVYALVFAAAALAHTLALTWVEAIVYRFGARASRRGGEARLTTAFWRFWTPSVLSLIFLGGLVLWLAPLSAEARAAGWFALVFVPIDSLLNARREAMRARCDAVGYAILETWRPAAGLGFGVALAVFTPLGAASPLAGALLGGAIALVFNLRALVAPVLTVDRPARAGASPPRRLMAAYAAYALPLTAVLALNLLLSAGDRLIIAALLNTHAVGVYAAAYGVADRTVALVFTWAGMAAAPFILRAYEAEGANAARDAARRGSQLILALGAPAAVGVALCAGPLCALVIAPDMAAGAARLTPWIAAGALMNGLVLHILSRAFELSRRTARQAALLAPAVLINVALNLVLLPLFGLIGAAMATFVAYLAAACLLSLGAQGPVRAGFPWRDAGKIGLACAVMAAGVMALPAPAAPVFALLWTASVGAALYGAALLALDAAGARSLLESALSGLRAKSARHRTESAAIS